MTLLSIIQDVCDAVSIESPTSVIGNTDQDIKQLLQLANLEGKLLADSYDWQALETVGTITTLAQEDQGAVSTLASGFKKMLNETAWNLDIRYLVQGSVDAQDWERLKAQNYTGPYPNFRIRGGRFLLFPVPAAGLSIRFEYLSKNWVLDSDASTTYSRWTNDDDTGLLDEDIMTLGVRWRYLKAGGFDYSEEFRDYEIIKANMQARDGGKMRKSLEGRQIPGGPFIPQFQEASWPL